jgi:hypothetical protein
VTGLVIPPGAEVVVRVECHFLEAGEATAELRLFTDCPGQAIVPLRVSARVQPSTASPAAKVKQGDVK